MVRVGVVGFGYWGPNLARNFADAPCTELVGICDARPEAAGKAKARHPSAVFTTDFEELLSLPDLDAVAVATPVGSHYDLVMRALEAGKHVLVEKPITASSREAERLVEEAEQRHLVLCVDHTFRFMGAVRKVKELIKAGELGDLYYLDSVRVNLGNYQPDVSVLWDLAVHDLSIVTWWVPRTPRSVSCVAVEHLTGHPADVAYLTLLYDDSFVVHVHVNWLSPVKVRRTLVGGSKKMIVFDDMSPDEKIRVYDRGVELREHPVGANLMPLDYRRTGDIWSPQFDMTEALRAEVEHFARCVEHGEAPISSGRDGLALVQILEAAEESIARQGQAVQLGGVPVGTIS